jgi:hypothetical protein
MSQELTPEEAHIGFTSLDKWLSFRYVPTATLYYSKVSVTEQDDTQHCVVMPLINSVLVTVLLSSFVKRLCG